MLQGSLVLTLMVAIAAAAPVLVAEKTRQDELTIDVQYLSRFNCGGSTVFEQPGNVCSAIPWTYRHLNQLLTGNSFITSLAKGSGDDYVMAGLGFQSADCSGTSLFQITYDDNVTEGCFSDFDNGGVAYELYFNGAETQSHRVESFFPTVVYHAGRDCNLQTLGTVTAACTVLPWTVINDQNGQTKTGASINTVYYDLSTDINYYLSSDCAGNPEVRIVSQLIGPNCIDPEADNYQVFISGVRAFTFTVDQ